MATRAIKTKRDDTMLEGWQSTPERAPSVMLAATPTLARFFFMVGLLLSAIGSLALLAEAVPFNYMVRPAWGLFFLAIGLALILTHAFVEKDEQFRRAYSLAGIMILCVSASLRVLPMGGSVGGRFLPVGFPGMCFGLLLLAAVLRNEINDIWRAFLNRILAIFGSVTIVTGIVFLNVRVPWGNFLAEGFLLLMLGLCFALVCMTYQSDWISHRISLGLGATGGLCFAMGAIRWWFLGIDFLVPAGLILMGMGLVYIVAYLGEASDWPIMVLTRREFAQFFYSPIAYPVLLGLALISWFNFYIFINTITESGGPVPEPIVQFYIVSLIPVFAQMFVVPVLTMRLLSEEQKSGTLEVLLTAPVNELPVVLSKFIGALTVYMLTWLPMWFFLVGLWVMGGEFDYRPVLSFSLAVAASGAGFIGMGIFCSVITRNQIIAAVLCFAGMMSHLAIYLVRRVQKFAEMQDFFNYISFIDLWINSLDGLVAPRFLFFHISLAVFFLFVTLKILESRKWK